MNSYKNCITRLATELLYDYLVGGNDWLYDRSTSPEGRIVAFIYGKLPREVEQDIKSLYKTLREE